MKNLNAIVQSLLKERDVNDGVSTLIIYFGVHDISFVEFKPKNLSLELNEFQEKAESISNYLTLVCHVKTLSMKRKYAKKQQVLQKLSS